MPREVRPGGDADERPLELADVLVELARDELDYVVRNVDGLALGLQLQDRDASLEVGRLDVDAQAQPEPRLEALFHAELLRRAIRRDHDLTLLLVERVERVEELGLRLLALGEELDVVDEEHVDVAMPCGELIAL